MVQFAVINESTAVTDAEVRAMVPAFQTQWNRDLAPIWAVQDAQFTWLDRTQTPPPGSWWLVFLDDSDQAMALAYHDVTDQGLPIAKVFARTLLADGAIISVGATHELCEMAVDPTINLSAQDRHGTFWAYEICDPVEADRYGYDIDGVLVTDFLTPAWFGFQNATGKLDFQSQAEQAFTVLPGGYAQKFDGNGWQQVNGAEAQMGRKVHVKTPERGTRRERRARRAASGEWRKSDPASIRNVIRSKRYSM